MGYTNDELRHFGVLGMKWGRRSSYSVSPIRSSHQKSLDRARADKLERMGDGGLRSAHQKKLDKKFIKSVRDADAKERRALSPEKAAKFDAAIAKASKRRMIQARNKKAIIAGKIVASVLSLGLGMIIMRDVQPFSSGSRALPRKASPDYIDLKFVD